MSEMTVHTPPIKDELRAADVIATCGVNEWRAVRVIDLRPYMYFYQGASATIRQVMVEVERMRFTVEEARAFAQRILAAADYAESVSAPPTTARRESEV